MNEGVINANECECGCVYVGGGSFTLNEGWLNGYDVQYGALYGGLFSTITINGGRVRGSGGYQTVITSGLFTLNGGKIGGSCDDIIYVENGGLSVYGGYVTGTPGEGGYGIHLSGGYMNLFNSPSIENNVGLTAGSRIILDKSSVGEDLVLPVESSTDGIFAQAWFGLLTEDDLKHFFSVDPTRGFRISDGKAEVYKLPGSLTAVSSWAELSRTLMDGGSVLLAGNISASEGDRYLVVPTGTHATLDLNGFTIDGSALTQGITLVIGGELILKDTRGSGEIRSDSPLYGVVRVQGGRLVMEAGSISALYTAEVVCVDNGTFTMNGGYITNSTSDYLVSVNPGTTFTLNGGVLDGRNNIYASIYGFGGSSIFINGGSVTGVTGFQTVYSAGTLTMTGGSVKTQSNHALRITNDDYGDRHGRLTLTGGTVSSSAAGKVAVCVNGGSSFTLAGNPDIRLFSGANVYLRRGAVMEIDSLGENVSLRVRTDVPGIFARGEGLTEASISRLTSEKDSYSIWLNDSGEAELYARAAYSVTFLAGEGSGEMPAMTAYEGVPFILPSCSFTMPEGMTFAAWQVDPGTGETAEYAAGEEIVCAADTIVTAVWQADTHSVLSLPAELQIIEDEAFLGNTSLDAVALPASVTRIGNRVFAYSSLRHINLPASLTFIADDAFEGCDFQSVTAKGEYALAWCVSHGITVK